MKWLAVLGVACVAGLSLPALAQVAEGIGDDDLRGYLGTLQLEARLDADLTGDGLPELVYIAADHNARVLGVLEADDDTTRLGLRLLGEARLPASLQSSVSLAIEDAGLVVRQIVDAGAVSVTSYRYRFDTALRQLQLVELSAERYSDVAGEGTTRISWNLDSGEYATVRGTSVTLDGGQDIYLYGPESRSTRPTTPVYLPATPDPLVLLELELKHGIVARQ